MLNGHLNGDASFSHIWQSHLDSGVAEANLSFEDLIIGYNQYKINNCLELNIKPS